MKAGCGTHASHVTKKSHRYWRSNHSFPLQPAGMEPSRQNCLHPSSPSHYTLCGKKKEWNGCSSKLTVKCQFWSSHLPQVPCWRYNFWQSLMHSLLLSLYRSQVVLLKFSTMVLKQDEDRAYMVRWWDLTTGGKKNNTFFFLHLMTIS